MNGCSSISNPKLLSRSRRIKIGMHCTEVSGRWSALIGKIASVIALDSRMAKFPTNLTLD